MRGVRHYIDKLQETLARLPVAEIEAMVELLHQARREGRQVFILGNGGSASTASHFACDLGKNTRCNGWPHFKVLALTDNMAAFSAYANDDGYENVFAYQLAGFVQPGDVVIGISTSGNSPNVLRAIELAEETDARTIGLTGFDGGRLQALVDIDVHVESDSIERVEDVHLMLGHLVTLALREKSLAEAAPASANGRVIR